MGRLSRALLREYGRFMDDLRIYVKGGAGGMGHPRLGGEGGKGGDVWLVAQRKMTLKRIKDRYPSKRFIAGSGTNSSLATLKGANGKDCEVNVPQGISITTDDGKVLGELDRAGDRLLVARGGIGGCMATNFLPSRGQRLMIHLDLKLIADVGLVGHEKDLRNIKLRYTESQTASLYTIQREYSYFSSNKINPEIADYAFTTIKPELGTVKYADFKQITVADLPGLIEGAHANKGRGHKFLKHVERTKQLLFVVDVAGFQLSPTSPFRTAFETVILLTKELELYKEELRTKSALLAINKMDLPNAREKLNEFMEQLRSPQDYMHTLPKNMIPEVTIKFKEIIPISAHSGEGIEELIMCLRKLIDEDSEKKIEDYQKQQLHALKRSEI